ncbi:Serine hydroxymethyltransferase [Phytophthora nicotianae]|uniref:Serine hydroxymethyltransferase n=1 Tax=Phytophthora nicotianae TaxID=4792 RepID=A0A0W8D5Q0_PHYNI|nr:Serine hydroxymethyltransferase [Phytophthora nicotianae]
MKVGYVFDERYLWHRPWSQQYSSLVEPFRHWESPETKRRFHSLLAVSGLLDQLVPIKPLIATKAQLERVHTRRYVEKMERLSAREEGGNAGEEAPFSQFAFDIAQLSAGGVLAAVDAVMDGRVNTALAKRVRNLGQKKVEWCQHYLLIPMVNLSEVFTSFQQAYDENTTRPNPYLPLLVETLSMEHPMLQDALQQWREYSKDVQLKMDELIADYEANRLVLLASSDDPATSVSTLDADTLSCTSQQVPVR